MDDLRLNAIGFAALTLLASVSAVLFYVPAFFPQKLAQYIQDDPERVDRQRGWVYVVGLFGWRARDIPYSGWAAVEHGDEIKVKMQLNSVLDGKMAYCHLGRGPRRLLFRVFTRHYCIDLWSIDPLPSTPGSGKKFILSDVSVRFPPELSLVCGKLGNGRTLLLLLALLGEGDLLAGQIVAPRSLPDALATFAEVNIGEGGEWVVPMMCAYVLHAAWLRNASVKDNILFNLPLDEARYQKTLDACALVTDWEILEAATNPRSASVA
ncbi:hypothetical protein FIBSPDRAFT_1043210 [Athelia psychrophila]|uniref:ABC transporter domain-containing protein n=1 Tax=Athelia psychrophila TaxID=1759441 RepID=A0A166LLD8_9AGAM|nr:hypothetical protein FIBSPDRAFT_1043210 [Fibularhizoctonia sp. CBS 109695]